MKKYKLTFTTENRTFDVVLDADASETPEEILRRLWMEDIVFFNNEDGRTLSIYMYNVISVLIACVE